jgi:small nuclear ribonucleoprotein (snRNP)-like protein
MDTPESPYRFLLNYIGRKIKVRLKNSECYRGLLADVGRSQHEGLGSILLLDVKKVNPYEDEFEWVIIRGSSVLTFYLVEI